MREIQPVEGLPQEQEALAGYADFLGSIALQETVERPRYQVNIADLVHGAAEGDVNAYGAAETNVSTTVIETILKEGNITRVHAGYDTQQGLTQFGHRYHDIQANALKYQSLSPELEERTHIEGLNWQRIEVCKREELLKDNWLVVFSAVADNVSINEAKRAGCFTDTMTLVIQATTENKDGIVTESAFVAGKDGDGDEDRHDLQALRKMYRQWGFEHADTFGATEMLRQAVLIPKSMMPHGVTNIAEMYDNQLGPDYFFGKRRQRQDYAAFNQFCMQRESQYRDITHAVMNDLIALRHDFGDDAKMAQQMMYDLVKEHAVHHAMFDETIDPTVFGDKAAPYIESGRLARRTGDWHHFMQMQQSAQDTAETSACGGGSGGNNDNDDSNPSTRKQQSSKTRKTEEAKIPNTITCIIKKCRAKSPKSQVVKPTCWECPKCRYKVDVCDGTVLRRSIYDTNEVPPTQTVTPVKPAAQPAKAHGEDGGNTEDAEQAPAPQNRAELALVA